MDKQRSTYYNYYTGKVWGKCDHYDLCINAGRLGVEYSTDIILGVRQPTEEVTSRSLCRERKERGKRRIRRVRLVSFWEGTWRGVSVKQVKGRECI